MFIELLTLGHFSRENLVLSYIRCQPPRGPAQTSASSTGASVPD
jgi:hypothetical protein